MLEDMVIVIQGMELLSNSHKAMKYKAELVDMLRKSVAMQP